MSHVCILGGGYAGLRVARALPSMLGTRWSITLVDRNEHHQLLTRLPELVSGRIQRPSAEIAFARVLPPGVSHLQAEVIAVDTRSRNVMTAEGTMSADVIVFAMGTAPDIAPSSGGTDYVFTVKSVTDALHLRDALELMRRQQPVVRVLVVGAGYTGIEVAGELSAPSFQSDEDVPRGKVQVRILSEDSRLLPHASPRLSAAASRVLSGRGVPILLKRQVARISPGVIDTTSGERFEADLLVWAGQNKVSVTSSGGSSSAPGGKISVDPYLAANSSGTFFVGGDAARIIDLRNGDLVPSSAQLAIQEAGLIARNIDALRRGKPMSEFRPRPLGEAVELGGHDAVAEIGGTILTGRAALALKRVALARYLSSLAVLRASSGG